MTLIMPRRILICDDERPLAEELSEFFGLVGWDVVTAWSYDEAVSVLLCQEPVQCLLTDRAMPDIGGDYLAAFAFGLPRERRPRVIAIMTGVPRGEDADILDIDALHISKPFDPAALEARFSAFLLVGLP
jgi:DNA-binding response OmpR family regulator